jgi:hypothetical protein
MNIKLFNSNDKSCDTCVAVSANFTLNSSSAAARQEKLRLGAGLGLGLGIPLLIIVTGLAVWIFLRRRAKKLTEARNMQPLDEWQSRTPPPPFSAGGYRTIGSAGGQELGYKPPLIEAENAQVAELPPEQVVVEAPSEQLEPAEVEGDTVKRPLSIMHTPLDMQARKQ